MTGVGALLDVTVQPPTEAATAVAAESAVVSIKKRALSTFISTLLRYSGKAGLRILWGSRAEGSVLGESGGISLARCVTFLWVSSSSSWLAAQALRALLRVILQALRG